CLPPDVDQRDRTCQSVRLRSTHPGCGRLNPGEPMKIPGVPPAEIPALVRAEDRISFLYLERSIIHRDSNAITATDDRGVLHIPAASIGVLLLGPGTSITHQAIALLADHGATVVWVGERGVRYYAHGRSLAASSRLLVAQAA